MNLLDRAIAVLAPAYGLKRAHARLMLGEVRGYDGALVGRRAANWRASNASANTEIKRSLTLLRARSRDLARNTWWGARIRHVFVAHAVGTGFVPRFRTGNKDIDRKAAAAWRAWGGACDAEGQLDINGLLALAVGTVIESGEALVRLVDVPRTPRNRLGLEVQLLEPDHLDSTRDRVAAGAIVDQGVEYDARGKRAAYWLLPQHPGAAGVMPRLAPLRVPAASVLHVYRKDRIGQGRGVPWLAPVMLKGRDVADLEEAIVVKSRIEACLSLFVETTDASRVLAAKVANEQRADGSKRRIETLSPGMIMYGEPGEKPTPITPSASIAFEHVLMSNWLALAAGAGLTYDQMTGDLRQANFASLRAGKIEFRRMVEQFQWLALVAMLLDPLMAAFVERAQETGVLPRRASGYPVEWIAPAVEPIEPLKDLQTDILAVRAGRMTFDQFVAAWGGDADQHLDDIEGWLRDIDARKVVLDCDPRRALAGVKGAPKSDAGQAAGAGSAAEPSAGASDTDDDDED